MTLSAPRGKGSVLAPCYNRERMPPLCFAARFFPFFSRLARFFLVSCFAAGFVLAPVRPVRADPFVRETLPGGWVLAPLSNPRPVPDPRFSGKTYRRSLGLWEPGRAQSDGPAHVVSLHYEDDADAALARRTARLCARLLRLHLARFGERAPFPRGAPQAHVFLRRDTPPGSENAGGQTWGENVWLFSTGRPERTNIEWTRTVAHEWGHLTLYAARGYRAPENDAAGFLGERLYLKWLREEGTAPLLANDENDGDGVDQAGLDIYHERQIEPLIARFRAGGPNAPALLRSDRDAPAMDLYVGAALACDDAFGSRLLGEALAGVESDDGPRPFLESLRRTTVARPVLVVRLPAWVPLVRAAYRVSPDAGTGRAAAAKIAVADRPPLLVGKTGAPPAPFSVRASGWKWMRALLPGPAAGIVVRLQRVSGGSVGAATAAKPR